MLEHTLLILSILNTIALAIIATRATPAPLIEKAKEILTLKRDTPARIISPHARDDNDMTNL